MFDRINVSYSQKGCKGNPQSYIKICKYSFSRSGVLLFRKAPLIHFYSYSVFFFFPEIPAITIINQKNGCLQFINVKLSASSASTAARCARSQRITFLPIQYTKKVVGINPYENQTSKKLEWISLTWNTSKTPGLKSASNPSYGINRSKNPSPAPYNRYCGSNTSRSALRS